MFSNLSAENSLIASQVFHDVCLSFLSIVLEGLPFLFLSAVVSGLVSAFVPPSAWATLMPRSKAGGLGIGIVTGFFMPMCECGSVAVVRRMLRQGLPRTVALTYLLASPILNPFCVLSTYYAFRSQHPWSMVGSRLTLGLILIIYLSWSLSRRRPQEILQEDLWIQDGKQTPSLNNEDCCGHDHGHDHGHDGHHDREDYHSHHSPRYLRFLHAVSEDFIAVLTFLVIGAAFAACLNTFLPRESLAAWGQHPIMGPVLGVFLAQVLCLCSTTDAFVIAAFPTFSFAAKLAFLVSGPLFDFKLVWMYQVIFRRRTVFWLWFNITLGTLLLIYLWRPI